MNNNFMDRFLYWERDGKGFKLINKDGVVFINLAFKMKKGFGQWWATYNYDGIHLIRMRRYANNPNVETSRDLWDNEKMLNLLGHLHPNKKEAFRASEMAMASVGYSILPDKFKSML